MDAVPEGASVVVVGSGIAGLTTALHAASTPGDRVTLVTKDALDHANTRFAQGGIAGVMFDDDRAEDHVRDTLAAGAGLSDEAAVRVLVEEGPDRIRELVALGVAFDRDASGEYVKGLEAAHSYPRILHAGGDATGSAIERALVDALRRRRIDVMEHAFLIDLVVADGRVRGVDLLVADRDRVRLDADAVVLATGGAGQLYAHTTNPTVATGDGVAAAIRAGAATADLEFVQFHPTVLAAGEPFLVSEAVRGEGATLIDDDGRRFVFDEHPDGELAPRDVVARAIAHRMAAQGGRPVRLDATALGRDFLARRFPTIDRAVRARGLDWAEAPIPVTPAAHFMMGGVVTDLDARTTLPGLYAVGEVARTGVHGANRLASNSLLEGAVFGVRAARALSADHRSPSDAAGRREATRPRRVVPLRARDDRTTAAPHEGHDPFTREALQALLWEHVGLLRDERGLRVARERIDRWRAAPRTPVTEREHEDENLLLVASAVVAAAIARPRSVGAHTRTDDPGAQPAAARADRGAA